MLHHFGDVPTRTAPKIRYTFEEFEGVNDPDHIRWRAMWESGWEDGLPVGIELRCYPVVRKTPCGAWIATQAGRQDTRQPREEGAPAYEWVHYSGPQKFVYDKSSAAWAKPTIDEALRSLGIRLRRWSARVRRDINRMNAACEVAEMLLTAPDYRSGPGYATFFRSRASASAAAFRIEIK
jgi:hypothetical protein